MQNSTFIGLDAQKATISVAIAQGERGGEARHVKRHQELTPQRHEGNVPVGSLIALVKG